MININIFIFILIFLFSGSSIFASVNSSISICGPVKISAEGQSLQFTNLKELRQYLNIHNFENLDLEINFALTPHNCSGLTDPGIFLGRIYDSDTTSINKQFIGSTGSKEKKTFQASVLERTYGIPKAILNCDGNNILDVKIKRLIPGRIGPIEQCFELNQIDEVISKAEFSKFLKVDSFKNIAFIFLALVPLFLTLFWGDPKGLVFRKFGIFLFFSGIFSLSLSGYFHSFVADTETMFRFNSIVVCLFLATLLDLVFTNWDLPYRKVNQILVGLTLVLLLFLPNLSMVNSVYASTLVFYNVTVYIILFSFAFKHRYHCKSLLSKTQWIAFLILAIGITFDVSRYFQIHVLPNMSPWFLVLAVLIIGSTFMLEVKQLFEKARSLEENKKNIEIGLLSSQVAHDIRSPLSALSMLTGGLDELPEQKRVLLRNSVNRINDIANSLLNHGKKQSAPSTQNHDSLENILLASLVDSLVSEKRIQLRDKINVQLEASLSNSYGLFTKVNPRELKRTLSNTINNAVEAFGSTGGTIDVILSSTITDIVLTIKDNGKGIPKHILDKLGQIGITHGKEGTESGSGLGVYHAKKTIESFGGKFEIHSDEGVGTSLIFTLKKNSPPAWFVESLDLRKNLNIFALDDDNSILEIWKQRFQEFKATHNVNLMTSSSGQSFKEWVLNNPVLAQESIFLMDYELLNQKQTGLDIIEEFKLNERAILVTSRYEETHIKSRCEKLNVKLIPKALAPLVPILIEKEKRKLHGVVIDDDSLVAMVWNMASKEKGLETMYFPDESSFLTLAKDLSKNTPIYIDVNLANSVRGQDVASRVHKMGFTQIHLSTGYQAEDVERPSFIKSVRSKDFPL